MTTAGSEPRSGAKRGTVILHGAETWSEQEIESTMYQFCRRWQGWHIVMCIDGSSPGWTRTCRQLAGELGIELRAQRGLAHNVGSLPTGFWKP